jgi:hypothetical protein
MVAAVQRFLDEFVAWASDHDGVLAVALVGSYARGQARDASDIDLIIVARDPEPFIRDPGWTRRFGGVDRQQVEHYGKVTSLRTFYDDCHEVEYGWSDDSWPALPLVEGTREVLAGGFKVLFERSPILTVAIRSAHDRWSG